MAQDIMSQMPGNQASNNARQNTDPVAPSGVLGQQLQVLKSMDATLTQILQRGGNMSQSDAINNMPGRNFGNPANRAGGAGGARNPAGNRWTPNRQSSQGMMDSFKGGLQDALIDGLLGSDFKEQIGNIFSDLAGTLGDEVSNVPKQLGQEVGKQMMGAFKESPLGQSVMNGIDALKNKALSSLTSMLGGGGTSAASGAASAAASAGTATAAGAGTAAAGAGTAAAGTVTAAGAGTAAAGTAAAGGTAVAAGGLAGLALSAALVIAPIIVIAGLLNALGPAIEGITQLFGSLDNAGDRYLESRKKNLEYAEKRMRADIDTMITEPFEILKSSAEDLYQAWDNQVRLINATQGYSKDDLHYLMGSFAERLRSEGLTSVIGTSDITTSLGKVLESGLSGQVAEEFAYLATKLNAAVPTQDFFGYADAYASLAANAIKNGQSEAQAIAYANEQMYAFASNVLYASRQISGGFSTGLKDAQKLFESSVQIATASKTGNVSTISGMLTSISAAVGAVAPDLASSLVDSVVKAATGGNASEIVALRSLAGVNASNTEFLRLLASNPQKLFTDLFNNLAQMQNMSNDNFMEVAEGLSSIFGISMDAFARVDFNYLAQAISKMNVNNASLNENMELLASGETTTSAEQLKLAQINKYMLEEGLAYVLDNEAARAIQEHMWEEQQNRELMEATYAVDLQGSALAFIEGIAQTVQKIIDFLNPLSFLKNIKNMQATAAEGAAQQADLRQLLELGKVGNGSAKALYNLTTTNQDLNLIDNLINLMGGHSAYAAMADITQKMNAVMNWQSASIAAQSNTVSGMFNTLESIALSGIRSSRGSRYSWGNTISKSVAQALSSPEINSGLSGTAITQSSTASAIANQTNSRFQQFIDSMQQFIQDNKSYEDWKSSARNFGIADFESALEAYGKTEAELQGYFTAQEAKRASQYNHDQALLEQEFWRSGTKFWTETHEAWRATLSNYQQQQIDNQVEQIALLTASNATLDKFYREHAEFHAAWVDYFISHTAYSKNTLSAYDVAGIRNAEKKENGDAILALANALTSNAIDLKDPAVQTNALLAKILIVVEALLQQHNQSGGFTLPTALAALGLGITDSSG